MEQSVSYLIKQALEMAYEYISTDMEAICDEDYYSEAEDTLAKIEEALHALQ